MLNPTSCGDSTNFNGRQMDETLINEVFRRPCLYDRKDCNHGNKEYVTACWTEIAHMLKTNAHDARRRWINIRDYFRKIIKEGKHNGRKSKNSKRTGAFRRKRWYLYDSMRFLIPHMNSARPFGFELDMDPDMLGVISKVENDFDYYGDENDHNNTNSNNFNNNNNNGNNNDINTNDNNNNNNNNNGSNNNDNNMEEEQEEYDPSNDMLEENNEEEDDLSTASNSFSKRPRFSSSNFQNPLPYHHQPIPMMHVPITAAMTGPTMSKEKKKMKKKKKKKKMRDEKTRRENYQAAILALVEDKKQTQGDGVDEDLLFFKSCLPNLKMLSPVERLEFRTEVSGLLTQFVRKSLARKEQGVVPVTVFSVSDVIQNGGESAFKT